MLLSEEEMEQIIASCFGMACPEKAAAHAIAEAMKGKVEWEAEGKAQYDGCCIALGKGTELILGENDEWDIVDGQRVRVYVVKEERDGQGIG